MWHVVSACITFLLLLQHIATNLLVVLKTTETHLTVLEVRSLKWVKIKVLAVLCFFCRF